MKRTNKRNIGRRAWLGAVVFLAAVFAFFLMACDSSIKDIDPETALSVEDLSRSVVAGSSPREKGDGFSRWAEKRGLSPEDFAHRHNRREYRRTEDGAGRFVERGRHQHKFGEGSKGENRSERRKMTGEGRKTAP